VQCDLDNATPVGLRLLTEFRNAGTDKPRNTQTSYEQLSFFKFVQGKNVKCDTLKQQFLFA
jgi:hypothetical protein